MSDTIRYRSVPGSNPVFIVFHGENLGELFEVRHESWEALEIGRLTDIGLALISPRPLVTVICEKGTRSFREGIVHIDTKTRTITINLAEASIRA